MDNSEVFVKIAGTGSFLPGTPIPADQVDYYLGELTEAPEKIRKWLGRIILDATGAGDPIYDDLVRRYSNIEPFKFSSVSKVELVRAREPGIP